MNPPDESNTAEPEEESLESSASGAEEGIARLAESSPAALEAASTGGEAAAEESPAVTTSVDISPPRGQPFPIVGIGASAGGLEAVTQLLHALHADAGLHGGRWHANRAESRVCDPAEHDHDPGRRQAAFIPQKIRLASAYRRLL